jgi:hypothetical protein
MVEYDGREALVSLDIGLGEPGQERSVLSIARLGSFELPVPVQADELLSVRARGLPEGTVTIKVVWREPK